jgi:aflatoxin B1 aldehyde reductase
MMNPDLLRYSPLAGGFLTGKVTFAAEDPDALHRTRWAGDSKMDYYAQLYNQPKMHEAIKALHSASSEEGITVTEASLRWLMHHSALEDGDAIIFGGKRISQIESNVAMCRKGPLGEKLVAAVEDIYKSVDGSQNTSDQK